MYFNTLHIVIREWREKFSALPRHGPSMGNFGLGSTVLHWIAYIIKLRWISLLVFIWQAAEWDVSLAYVKKGKTGKV